MNSGTAAKTTVSRVATTNLLTITAERRTGVASRCTMLPSSISAPSTLVPMISAVTGSITVIPSSPRIPPGQFASGGLAALSAAVMMISIRAGRKYSRARLRPSAARSVSPATVGLNSAAMSVSGCQEAAR
jgi:hypothetical protein